MTINERMRYLRKDVLKMNQTDFAKKIGMKQTSVSSFEKQGATVTEQTLKSICMSVQNLNEDWLRNGKEPMYIPESTFSLDKFVKDHGGTELELEAIKAYFELDPDIRKMLVKHFKERLATSHEEPAEPTMTVEEANKDPYIESAYQTMQVISQDKPPLVQN